MRQMRNLGTVVVEEIKGRDSLRDLGVDGSVTFKLMSK